MDALAASPLALLDAHSSLRLVTDMLHEDDVLCLALVCRALRDALWARFPPRPAGDAHSGRRLRTRDAAVVGRVQRLEWAQGLSDRPAWLCDARAWPSPTVGGRDPDSPIVGVSIAATIARCGNLAVLQWARASGCDWDEGTCREAAGAGHLAVLQWARANGCGWNSGTCTEAARGGHLEVLQVSST
jgi:hypothetical protein